jgi:RIO-like serine/threonine protein kinase
MGIHYSTAKTILFFHRHSHRSYRKFKIKRSFVANTSEMAGIRELSPGDSPPNRI